MESSNLWRLKLQKLSLKVNIRSTVISRNINIMGRVGFRRRLNCTLIPLFSLIRSIAKRTIISYRKLSSASGGSPSKLWIHSTLNTNSLLFKIRLKHSAQAIIMKFSIFPNKS